MISDGPQYELADTLEDKRPNAEPNSSEAILEALDHAERAMAPYMQFCRTVDNVYSSATRLASSDSYSDQEMDIFWASMEILKPAIYAKAPKPVAAPRFKDGGKLEKTVGELIERCLESTFSLGDIDQVMLNVRDDLALTNRGVAWVMYESEDGQRVCVEHLDRMDFRHEPARKWSDVGWVARRAWMTRREMRERFKGDAWERANFLDRDEDKDEGSVDGSVKASVWEVWSKVDNRVYWVSEGVDTILDEDEPHLNLRGFFPCPRPAYGTLARRSLVPVPDYKRYAYHLDQINDLTVRIYDLLERVRLKVLIPAGGDIGAAVETALTSEDSSIVIPVPAAAFAQASGNSLMLTLPLVEVATTIQGLIEARSQLIQDFYQLSGISDIMRGATEANETLGAQQLKTQYGSVRVRDKIDELQRLARDVAEIAAEIISENFSEKTLLDTSRMTIPTRREVDKKIADLKAAAKNELEGLMAEAEEAAGQIQQGGDPQQAQAAEQAFNQKQAQIIEKYQAPLQELGAAIVIEDVMEMLRDTKARNLIIDIETDSTILTDEMAEKASRAEFMNAVGGSMQSLAPIAAMGEHGRKLAGGMIKFALQPFRTGRELDALIDEFVDSMEGMAQPQEGAGDAEKALAEANQKLAEAELQKAAAQTQKVQADAQLKAAELQARMQEIQAKAVDTERKAALEIETLRGALSEQAARIEKLMAETALIVSKTGVDVAKVENDARKTDIEAARTAADIEARNTDQAMRAEESQRSAVMGERQQTFNERQAMAPQED